MNLPPYPLTCGGRRGAITAPLTLTLVLVAGGAAALVWWTRGTSKVDASFDADRVVEVAARDVIDSVTATGRVEPLARVAVMSRASGIIEKLLVEEGDRVSLGQVLAELDREQLEAQHQENEGQRLAAQARVAAARARVEEARVRAEDPEAEYLEREVQRLRLLREQGDVSPRELDTAEQALAMARFRVQLALANLPVLEAAVTEAEAGLSSAQATLERSATALREATILSPIEGVVLTRDKEIGDGVSSILTAGGNATQLLTLGDLSSMHVEARVDEVDLGRISTGMPVLLTVDAHRDLSIEGEVERIAPAGSIDDNGIVTFEVRISVGEDQGLLRPDMTADAKLVIARRNDVPCLPQVAFQRGSEDQEWSVERIRGETTERVPVELGLSDGLMTEVLSGLEIGDRVVLPIARRGR